MNAIRNKVQLIGRAGGDPEVKNYAEGKKLAIVNIATNDYYTNEKGEKVEDTQWHRVVCWGKLAELVEKYVTKGKEVVIDGKLHHKQYDDKNGEKRYHTEVVAQEVLFL